MSVLDLDDGERRRLVKSAALSCAFWIVALGLLAVIPARLTVDEKRDFPVIAVRLNARAQTTARQTAEPVAAPSDTPAAAPAAPKQTAAPKRNAAAKQTAAAKPAAAKAATDRSAAAPSNGLGIPDFAPVDRGSPADRAGASRESATLEFSSEPVGKPRPARTAVSEFEGSVAVASGQRGGERVTANSPTSASAAGKGATGASAETARSLSSISDAAGTGSGDSSAVRDGATASGGSGDSGDAAAGSSRASATQATQSRSGGSSVGAISFTEGAQRRLVSPASPSLALPDRLARLIDSNRAVFVTLTVRADGSVPRSTVVFSPSALLPPEVRDYIAGEVSSWRFDRGSGDGQARFSYSIKVQ